MLGDVLVGGRVVSHPESLRTGVFIVVEVVFILQRELLLGSATVAVLAAAGAVEQSLYHAPHDARHKDDQSEANEACSDDERRILGLGGHGDRDWNSSNCHEAYADGDDDEGAAVLIEKVAALVVVAADGFAVVVAEVAVAVAAHAAAADLTVLVVWVALVKVSHGCKGWWLEQRVVLMMIVVLRSFS